ncbi:hypothetical protein CYY_009636 [Polysphondylium violaceum]|uniref:Structural maintenance of chromosomes protein n=1 Tax=Polysphondylium violaceum TaxID=133409 RepID=A0A8J4UVR5_9MYCE|nr:hypothetical protein CYY_009636 [Polysphondylium violaceum]
MIISLEIKDFKSYKGIHNISLFKEFSCVIGPNGSGKSNILDAIIFVLGQKASAIRGSRLSELVYFGAADKTNTYVKLNFLHQISGKIYPIMRKIVNTESHYYLDDRLLSYKQFATELAELGINIASKNFFILQGDVESIAMQNPKQIADHIEKVSGSKELKDQYDEAFREKNKIEDDVFTAYAKKKTIAFEKEQYKEQWSEVKEYHEMQRKMDTFKCQAQLSKLLYVSKQLKKEEKHVQENQDAIATIRDQMEPLEQSYSATSKKQAALHKDVMALEDKLAKLSKSKKKRDPESFKIAEEIKYINNKIKKTKQILEKAEQNRSIQLNEIEQLKKELLESTNALQSLEQEGEQSEVSHDVKMTSVQMEEYNKLKLLSGKETSALKIRLDQLNRDQRIDQDSLNTLKVRLGDYQKMIEQFQTSLDKYKSSLKAEEDIFAEIQRHLTDAQQEYEEASTAFTKLNSKQNTLNLELDNIQFILSDLKSMKSESQRDKSFNETVETLKSIFPGVKGKLSDLCEPVQRKYATALTLTMGKFMDAIVCDSEQTLMSCVKYLKDQMLGVATFLSLDRLQGVKPVNAKLRQLSGTGKLLFDCLKIQKGIDEAVLYALGNTVVCDSLAEARLLAFGSAERMKVITIQGVKISKSGLMSGGGLGNVKSKSSQWDNKRVEDLKRQRDSLIAELQENGGINEIFNKKQDLLNQVNELKAHYNLSKSKITLLKDRSENVEKELQANKKSLKTTEPEIKEITSKMDQRKQEMDTLNAEIRSIEDQYFKDFSATFGVENIREFEENRLVKIQENIQKRLEITQNISKIQSRLDYEASRQVDSEIKQLEEEIESNEKMLDEEMENKKSNDEKEQQFESELSEIVNDYTNNKQTLEEMNVSIKEIRKKMNEYQQQITEIEKKSLIYHLNTLKLGGQYHNILLETRNENIILPILEIDGKEVDSQHDHLLEQDADADKMNTDDESKKSKKSDTTSEEEEEEDENNNNNKNKKSKSTKKPNPPKKTRSKRKRNGDASDVVDDQDLLDEEDELGESDIEMDSKTNYLQDVIVDIPVNADEEHIKNIYKRESFIVFDYSLLPSQKKPFKDQKTFDEHLRKINLDIESISKDMKRVMPNYKAYQHLDEVTKQLSVVRKELDESRKRAKEINDRFSQLRDQRKSLFMKAFKKISKNLTSIYSELTRELEPPFHRGSAHLALEDNVTPFNAGVKFTVIPPNKRFQEMDQLSGGEKSVAALAFLFSLQGFKSTPFLILDEIDAAFDSVNVLKLVRYVKHKANRNLQFIVISLKELFYVHSDSLIGICRERDSTSASFSLDLQQFTESKEAEQLLVQKGEDETDDLKTSSSSSSSSDEN